MFETICCGMNASGAFFFIAACGVFVFGCCIGSFLNVCVWRIPRGESIVSPPSHCPKCGHGITAAENIPILSWLFLRGKCSSCHAGISPRYIIVEALTGILYTLLFLNSGRGCAPDPGYFVLLPLLLCCALTDCELGIIPDEFTWFGIAAGLGCSFLREPRLYHFLFSLFSVLAAGGLTALCAMSGRMLFKREALGWGDVKFIAMCAAFLGVFGAFFTVLAGSLSGLLCFPLLRIVKKRRSRSLRFGPHLAFGALLWMFFGARLLELYLTLTGRR